VDNPTFFSFFYGETKMTQKKSLFCLLSLTLLLSMPLQTVSAQNLESLSDYSLKLAISPSHIEEGPSEPASLTQ
jgi:hypothetical protein